MTEPVIEKGKFHPWEPGYWGQEMEKPPEQKAEKVKPTKFHPWEPGYWDGVKPSKTPIAAPKTPGSYTPLIPKESMLKEAIKGPTGEGYTKEVLNSLEADVSKMTPMQQAEFKKLKGKLGA
jgi:hypothetical protein